LIYLINLDKRTERLQYLEHRFLSLGSKFKRISAIDGSSLDDDYFITYKKYVNSGKSPVMTNNEILRPNQIGCSLSHFKVYSELIQGENDFCVVLEDDIDFSIEFIEMIHGLCFNKLNDGAVIILLGYYKDNNVIEKGKYSFFFKKENITSKIKICQPREWYFGSHAYIINKKAANIILDRFDAPTLPADYLLGYAPKLGIKLRITEFPLVWINEIGLQTSDIQFTGEPNSVKLNQKIKFGPRSYLLFIFKKFVKLFLSIHCYIRSNFTFSDVPFYVKKMPIHD
jgi:glycosyl transferase family 25